MNPDHRDPDERYELDHGHPRNDMRERCENEAMEIADWWMGMRRCSKQMLAEKITTALLKKEEEIEELKERIKTIINEDMPRLKQETHQSQAEVCVKHSSRETDVLIMEIVGYKKTISDLQEKLKAAKYCLNEVYDVLRMTYTEESETPLLVKQTLQKISEDGHGEG